VFAVLHVGSFALRAALRLHAIDERAKHAGPAALFSANTRPSTVLACTEAARVSGVSVGMTAPQALARCPRLVALPAERNRRDGSHRPPARRRAELVSNR
jgi:nucleotidyltransferase/DNA polymerase involved in DNA repair